MTEQTHFEKFVEHITSDDIREISKIRAERDYALHCLEREIAICSQTQARNDALVKLASKLAREVLGSFELFEPLARQQMGNTNYRIIVDDAEAVLASIKVPS